MSDLLWCDLETTGLDEGKCSILEIAVAKAAFNDPFNAELIYHAVVWFPEGVITGIDQYVVDMHTKNGLWKECADEDNAKDIFEIQDELLKLIPEPASRSDMPILAGSSIHFDRKFIRAWMPKFDKRLSHQHYDVSSLKLQLESQGMPKFRKAEAHCAKDDIFESIQHGKECIEWARQNLK